MSPSFTPDSPVVQAVKTVLRQHPDGLTIPEIRRELVKQDLPGVLERDIEEIVRLPDFRRQPGGRVILREMEPDFAEEGDESDTDRPAPPYSDEPSTLRDLPSLDAYVIFDVETNGLKPESSDFFQLSAIKVVQGEPVDARDWYAHVDTGTITKALQVKLHFNELCLEDKIKNAGTQAEAVGAFRAFVGDLPLVAHNGTFDIAFLRKHDPELHNRLIDSLELLCLAFPAEPSHSLERLSASFGLVEGESRWSEVLALDTALGVSAGLRVEPGALFHSAIFDCLVLYILLQDALAELRRLNPVFKAQVRRLSPGLGDLIAQTSEVCETSEVFSPTPPADLGELIALHGWEAEALSSASRLPEPGLVCDAPTALRLYDILLEAHKWQPRKSQDRMIRRVQRIFAEGGRAMIEAPTGTGKTLAYVLPALALARGTGQQVVISTNTKVLQDQLLNDLKTRVQPAMPFDFHFTVLKGQENYLCLTKLWDAFLESFYGDEADDTPFEEKLAVLYLLRFAEISPTGDLDSTSFWLQKRFPVLEYLKTSLRSERETCGSYCTYFPYCFHPRAKALADGADLLVINHTLLLVRRWAEDRLLNLVLDEAHNLEDAATNTLTDEASQSQIETLLARLLRPDGKRGALIRARQWLNDASIASRAMGFVRRSFNFTLMANILLNRSPAWLLERLFSDQAELLRQLVKNCGVSDKRGIQLDLLAAARAIGADPLAIDGMLTGLSAQGWAVYRPWDRGYVLEAQDKLKAGVQAQLSDAKVSALRHSMQRNLTRMVRYAESLGAGDCRRRFILRYFGETLAGSSSPCCDLCHPDMPLPWRDVPSEAVQDFPTEVDPAYIALRAIAWNESLQEGRYT